MDFFSLSASNLIFSVFNFSVSLALEISLAFDFFTRSERMTEAISDLIYALWPKSLIIAPSVFRKFSIAESRAKEDAVNMNSFVEGGINSMVNRDELMII
jgi:hypothetical protein